MLGTTTLASLLDEQTSVLQTRLKGVYDGDADAVHDSRVATRRIRELLALVPSIPGRDGEASVTSGYRKMGRALGRVRDVDVQIAHLRELEAHAPQTAPSLVLVRQGYEKKRLRRMRQLIKTLERLDVTALLHFVGDGHPAGLRTRLTSSGWRQQIRRLAIERSRTAIDAMEHATGVYFPKRSHSARIALKQLRYAGEIALRTGFEDIRNAISVLKKGQEILGELHDKQVLADALGAYLKKGYIDAEHLKITGQVLEGDVLQIHSDYLCRRDGLREACLQIERAASRTSQVRSAVGVGAALVVSGLVWNRARAGIKEKASNTKTKESDWSAGETAELLLSATR